MSDLVKILVPGRVNEGLIKRIGHSVKSARFFLLFNVAMIGVNTASILRGGEPLVFYLLLIGLHLILALHFARLYGRNKQELEFARTGQIEADVVPEVANLYEGFSDEEKKAAANKVLSISHHSPEYQREDGLAWIQASVRPDLTGRGTS